MMVQVVCYVDVGVMVVVEVVVHVVDHVDRRGRGLTCCRLRECWVQVL